ncbi:MAG: hypothetical protein V1749_08660 [Candidatus Desantisbacteria bacterium]
MIDIPRDALLQYNSILTKKSIPISSQHYYQKSRDRIQISPYISPRQAVTE